MDIINYEFDGGIISLKLTKEEIEKVNTDAGLRFNLSSKQHASIKTVANDSDQLQIIIVQQRE